MYKNTKTIYPTNPAKKENKFSSRPHQSPNVVPAWLNSGRPTTTHTTHFSGRIEETSVSRKRERCEDDSKEEKDSIRGEQSGLMGDGFTPKRPRSEKSSSTYSHSERTGSILERRDKSPTLPGAYEMSDGESEIIDEKHAAKLLDPSSINERSGPNSCNAPLRVDESPTLKVPSSPREGNHDRLKSECPENLDLTFMELQYPNDSSNDSASSTLTDRLRQEVDELRRKSDASQTKMKELIEKLGKTEKSLERSLLSETKLKGVLGCAQGDLERAQSNNNRMEHKVQDLLRRNDKLSAEVDRLTNSHRLDAASLDVFNNTLDQVSEADVKCNGRSSLEGLNDEVDNLVVGILEATTALVGAHREEMSTNVDSHWPELGRLGLVVATIARAELSEEHRGLLLDALLHDSISYYLYCWFFSEDVTTISTDGDAVLNQVFHNMKEPWSVSARWRAITTNSHSQTVATPEFFQDRTNSIAETIIEAIAWAYRLPSSSLQELLPNTSKQVLTILRGAHELSLVIKRDILSVRMSVTLPKCGASIDPESSEMVWPEMGARKDDLVIGVYSLGLQKLTEKGIVTHLTPSKAITDALLRETQR